ncbi:MAG: DUF3857 domain-containing transglutaminase family protein [Opitutaceae bacterium]
MDTIPSTNTSEEKAIQQVSYPSIPEWVVLNDYDVNQARRESEPITQLILDIQYDVAKQACFYRSVRRLENRQAVQELSQWRMNFDPNTQHIQLHSIQVIRDGEVRDYTDPKRFRIIQREEDLESYILHGEVTLLMVMENIRIGDLLDVRYTVITKPQLLPNHFSFLQGPPNSFSVGQYRLSVRFPKDRPLRWKSGTADNAPTITEGPSHTHWAWQQSDIEPVEPEANVPSWDLPKSWIQVSDMQAWTELSSAAYEAWPNDLDFQVPDKLQALLGSKERDDAIEAIICYVQDEFRYLSVKTALGGQIPTHPKQVIERYYGDCKDLCCLLVHLFRTQSVEARVMLVNSNLGKKLPDLLPSATLFDHVIVEYELDGKPYWIDPTLSEQGGYITGRHIHEFKHALPIQAEATELVDQPKTRTVSDRYELHDTIMLDTAGNPSILRVATTVSGKHADSFREQLAQEGVEGFTKNSVERQKDRYTTNEAAEPVKFKDDRKNNVWEMIEIYKIDFFESMKSSNDQLQIAIPPSITMTALPIPEEKKTRTHVFAIPDDLDITHVVEVRSKTNRRLRTVKREFAQAGVLINFEAIYRSETWIQTTHLRTSNDHVIAEKTADYRRLLSDFWETAGWTITAPRGVIRLHRPSDFGDFQSSEPKKVVEPKKEEAVVATKPRRRRKVKQQRLASHPDEIEDQRRARIREEKSHPEKQGGFLKSIAFWKK